VIVAAVLDASAVLAYLRDESGADLVEQAIARGAALSTVNLSEVCAKLNDHGVAAAQVTETIEDLNLVIEPFLREDAERAGGWRALTRDLGLSLGDRACLALALRLDVPALTTDRAPGRGSNSVSRST
jgi:ribonuclease VapC